MRLTTGTTTSALTCEVGHAFDVSRQRYVNLLPGGAARPASSDTPEMLDARARFLASGHFKPIAAAVVAAVLGGASPADPASDLTVAEVGAGTGYYLVRALDALPKAVGLALDSSKPAARRAAHAHCRAGSVVCDVWQGLPVADASLDLVLNVFAPRNPTEFARVLRPGGSLLLVTPTPAHLAEIIAPLGMISVDAEKPVRLAASLETHFAECFARRIEAPMSLDASAVADLAMMGPSSRHIEPAALTARVDALATPVRVTLSVDVRRFGLRR
ncbi:MAG: methyltransferase domain-containing protein [Coriobacteriia bacterium]|nr:methyltransferase domain-containing protein [Coriobacteriia bacterium]